MNICLFTEEEAGMPLDIKDERAVHILKILNKKEGDSFFGGIINGDSGNCKIIKITDKFIEYIFTPVNEGKMLYPLEMIIGFPRPIQLKRLLRSIAGLGVSKVYLSSTELGEKSYMKSNYAEYSNAYKMLLDGTVQAGDTHVPELFIFKKLKDCLDFLLEQKKSMPDNLRIALDNINPPFSLSSVLKKMPAKNIIAAVGSERGWTEKERALFENCGFVRCGMGNRILRTETAAAAAAAIISASQGWLD